MKIFSPDGALYRFMQRLTQCVFLNFLWVVFSLPVITVGASTAAVFAVTRRMLDEEEGHIWPEFWKGFKDNLKMGIPMGLLTILAAWAVYLDFQLFSAAKEHSVVFLCIGIFAAYIFSFSLLYVYPLMARYENTFLNTIKNSFRISMKFFLRSVLLIIAVAFEVAVLIFNMHTLIIGILVGPVLVIYTISFAARGIFNKLEENPQT
jgi:uncharacterized membrane protein YesL